MIDWLIDWILLYDIMNEMNDENALTDANIAGVIFVLLQISNVFNKNELTNKKKKQISTMIYSNRWASFICE